MNQAFSQLEQRQLNNIRIFRAENIAPVTQQSHTCVYLFSGPDFLYADAMFSDCSTFVLQGLEPVVPLPDLATVPPGALAATLQNIETSLNTILSFSFFKTKDMRENLERSELKGVLPAIAVFMARTGKEIKGIDYLSLDKTGAVVPGFQGATRGTKVNFTDTATGAEKVLYYFTADLSDDALKRNPGLLRFCEGLGPSNSLLKAASYLLHEGGFDTARNFLLQNSAAILQDDSGIPVHYFAPDRWTLRFFGIYTGPIDLFKKFYQADLRQYYAASSPKPLTFGFGYRWSSRTSTLFLACENKSGVTGVQEFRSTEWTTGSRMRAPFRTPPFRSIKNSTIFKFASATHPIPALLTPALSVKNQAQETGIRKAAVVPSLTDDHEVHGRHYEHSLITGADRCNHVSWRFTT